MLRHFGLCVGLYLGVGHFSVVEFWSMQGVSDALLGHAALRLRWPYLRLTLSNIHAMLVCCCVPLSPIHINTQYQSINIKQSCTLVAHDVSSASPVPTIDKVNKCKSHPKNERQPKRLCIFQGKGCFSCALSI